MKSTHSAADAEALGDRFRPVLGERFELLQPIAIGGMATLFQLRHRLNGGLMVAKVLHPDLAGHSEVVESFRREAAHAALVGGHPNAVPIFDSGAQGDLHFILMPFVKGQDLDHLLVKKPLSRADALRFGTQVCNLLCWLERHGMAHCDLAPGNIRFDRFGRYRVLDFGLSHALGEPYYSLGGTPLYTSPEQIRGETPDRRSDLYSFGLVLAEVVTGKPLIAGTTQAGIEQQHLQGLWKLPPIIDADPPFADLLRHLLAVDRAERPDSAADVLRALSAFGASMPPRQEAVEKEAPPVRRARLSH